MSPPSVWGPHIWTMFHVFAEKIIDDKFPIVFPAFLMYIRRICSNLPCPDCTFHAKSYLARVNYSAIKSKSDLKSFLNHFHNTVNIRKRKEIFKPEALTQYTSYNMGHVVNNFYRAYTTSSGLKLLADSFHRKAIAKSFIQWYKQNLANFTGSGVNL